MVDTTKLAAEPRERAGKGAARAVRRQGKVPAVIYGDGKPPTLIQIEPRQLARELEKPAFFTRLFELALDGGTERVLPRDVQFHPVTDLAEHVDFMRVSERTRLRVGVPVKFENQDKAPGLKRGGVLNVVRHTVDVYCRMDNIPRAIVIDLDGLDIGDSIHISAVKLPEGVTPTIARNFTIAAIAAPSVFKSAEEEAAEAAAKAATAAAAAPAEGAAAEGAAPAAAAPAAAGDKKPAAAPAAAKAPAKK